MTPDDERELVRKVGLTIEHAEGPATDIVCESEARAAIAVVLEEAAKVAESPIRNPMTARGITGRRIAGEIRALNPKER